MFQFPRFPSTVLCVQTGMTGHDPSRVSPFGYPRIEAWSAAPRGFSQPPTSFIGIWRQGIHRWLFVAWDISSCTVTKDARARSAVLKGPVGRRARGAGPARGARYVSRLECVTEDEEARAPSQRNRNARRFGFPVVLVLLPSRSWRFPRVGSDPRRRVASDRRRSARA